MVTGPNVTSVFRSTRSIGSKTFLENVLERMWEVPKAELALWHNDMSGRGKVPAPGTEKRPQNQRYWAIDHHLYNSYLTHKLHSNRIASEYHTKLTRKLNARPLHEWQTTYLMSFLKREMTETAVEALFGTQILKVNPGFIEKYWKIDYHLVEVFSLKPRWLKQKSLKMRDELVDMMRKYIESAWEEFNWSDPIAREVSPPAPPPHPSGRPGTLGSKDPQSRLEKHQDCFQETALK